MPGKVRGTMAATTRAPKLQVRNATKVYNTRSGDLLAIDTHVVGAVAHVDDDPEGGPDDGQERQHEEPEPPGEDPATGVLGPGGAAGRQAG